MADDPHSPASLKGETGSDRPVGTGLYAAFFLSLTAAVASLGGLSVLLLIDFPSKSELLPPAVVLAVSVPSAVGFGVFIHKQAPRALLFSSVLFAVMSVVTLFVGNAAGGFLIPKWPTLGLHGVPPEAGRSTWGHADVERIGFNSWGQQDRERALAPAPGVFRAAFIGDSFMEETSLKLPVRTEEKIGDPRVEIINLGIANTSPDEYFYRIRNIALPLGARRCYMFLYAGNDFVKKTSLRTFGGVAAVYPRESLLSILRLRALNHVLTNRLRPILQAWWNAKELAHAEVLKASLVAGTDDQVREALLSLVAAPYRKRLAEVLAPAGTKPFIDMLRHPDEGLFRSYIIEAAFRCAVGEKATYLPIDEGWAYAWVKRSDEACRRKGAEFTLVLVPDASQVDARMRAQYSSVADLKVLFKTRREACDRIILRAQRDHIDTIDLHPLLERHPGSYMNLDGHWSPAGVELVADFMAQEVKKRVKRAI